jgi:hypothetical protein
MKMKPTWRELLRREPRLRSLYLFARDYVPPTDRPFCRMFIYDFVLDPQIERLIGWSRQRHDGGPVNIEKLAAYIAAHNRILGALPRCSHDGSCEYQEPVL